MLLMKQLMSKKPKLIEEKGTSVFYDEETEESTTENMGKSVFYNGLEEEEKDEGISKSIFYNGDEEYESPICGGGNEFTNFQVRFNQPSTVLWAESENVISSGILENMTTYEIARQESKFEVITSELRYMNSLSILITKFYESIQLRETCKKEEWKSLFGNILAVKKTSAATLSDLVSHWERDIMLTGIYPILRRHSINALKVYVEYCKNQPFALITLQTLMVNNEKFFKILHDIEQEQESFMSFLALPMQRVTRIPLLLDVILTRLDQTTTEYTLCRLAIAAFKQVAEECNAAINQKDINATNVNEAYKVHRSSSAKK